MEQKTFKEGTEALASLVNGNDSQDNRGVKAQTECQCRAVRENARWDYRWAGLRLPWFVLYMGLICLNGHLQSLWIWLAAMVTGCMLLLECAYHGIDCLIHGKHLGVLGSLYYMVVIAIIDWYLYNSLNSLLNTFFAWKI